MTRRVIDEEEQHGGRLDPGWHRASGPGCGRPAGGGRGPAGPGRSRRGRLREAVGDAGWSTYVAPTPEAVVAGIREARPGVVLNTVGPFTRTAPAVVDACLAAGSDYVDLANDLLAVTALLDRHADAERAGRTLVTGAGFGVTATESVVVRLCEDARAADQDGGTTRRAVRVRTDMLPSLAVQAGALGEALAGTLVEGLPGAAGRGAVPGAAVRRRPAGARGPRRRGAHPGHAGRGPGQRRADAAGRARRRAAGQRRARRGVGLQRGAVGPAGPGPASGGRQPAGRRSRSAGWPHVASRPCGCPSTQPRARTRGVTPRSSGTTARRPRAGCGSARPRRRPTPWRPRWPAASCTAEGRPGAFTPAALFGSALATDLGGTWTAPGPTRRNPRMTPTNAATLADLPARHVPRRARPLPDARTRGGRGRGVRASR